MKRVDYTGRRFGKLVVIEPAEKSVKRNRTQWLCRCDCGNIKNVVTDDLQCGGTTSCGCMSSRNFAGDRTRTHGMRSSKIYNVYRAMKSRCDDPKNKSYKDYGEHGITYSEDWKTFEGFYTDMGSTYKEGLTLERLDNYKGYCKENCIWADRFVQASNKRGTRVLEYDGVSGTLAELCRHFNVVYRLAYRRLNSGYTIEQIFTAKPYQRINK